MRREEAKEEEKNTDRGPVHNIDWFEKRAWL